MRVKNPFFANGSLCGPITITHELCLCGRVKENPKGWTRSLAPFKFNNKVTYWVLSRRLIEYLDGDGVCFYFLLVFRRYLAVLFYSRLDGWCPVNVCRTLRTNSVKSVYMFCVSNGMKTHNLEVFKLFHKVSRTKKSFSFNFLVHKRFLVNGPECTAFERHNISKHVSMFVFMFIFRFVFDQMELFAAQFHQI